MTLPATALGAVLLTACGSPDATPGAPLFGTDDPSDVPIRGLSPAELDIFNRGDQLFGLPFREYDGLGPLYIRVACASCHNEGGRGPGLAQKMAVVLDDGVTGSPDQSRLPFGDTVRPQLAGGAKTPLVPPDDPTVKVTVRVGPPVLGHGYMEAVADSEIERIAALQAQRTDGIHGRINRVAYTSEANPDTRFHNHKKGETGLIGRFGQKARSATIDDFAADALQRDIGITSPLRPTELPNPDGLTDDLKPGIDATIEHVNTLAMYVRMLAIPKRTGLTERGRALFVEIKCSVCHVPSLRTRADYPIAVLAGTDAHVYTDFLLHRWAADRSDGMTDGTAESRDWRTAPLIGLRFNKSFLHDGSASTIEQAILEHAGDGAEPNESVMLFVKLSPDDRKALVDFVSAL